MSRFLFSAILCLCFFYHPRCMAQSWLWVHDTAVIPEAGGAQNISADNFGNVYCVGESSLLRHNAATGEIKWYRPLGGSYNLTSITTDNAGYVYLYATTPGGFSIKKIDSFGNIIWNAFDSGMVTPWSISVDNIGHLYVTGYLWSPQIIIGHDTIVNTPPMKNSYMIKYDTSGVPIWGKLVSSPNLAAAYSIVGNRDNGFYLSGVVDTNVLKIGDTIITLPYVQSNIFVAKFDSNRRVIWISSNKHKHGFFYYYRREIQMCTDGAENVYLAGSFMETEALGSVPIPYTPVDFQNVFVAKYRSSNGNVLWAKTGYGSGVRRLYSFATNRQGQSCIIFPSNTVAHVGDSVYTFSRFGSAAVPTTFASLDSNGKVLCGFVLGGHSGDDECGIGIDNLGNGYVCGDYIDSCQFGPLSLHTGSSISGFEEYFVSKFSPPLPMPLPEATISWQKNATIFSIFPNPAFDNLTINSTEIISEVAIINPLGAIVYSTQCKTNNLDIDLKGIATGLYFIKVNGSFIQKIAKL